MSPARRPLFALLVLLAAGSVVARGQDSPRVVSRIAFGSCADQDKPLPVFDAIAAARPDLLVLLGDNIYADLDKTRKVTSEVIAEKYDILAKLPGWQKLKAVCPTILATWDDHDYGKNDAGVEYPLKDESQKLFLDFFGVPADSPRRQQKGVYSASIFGPPGKRVQVILLDGRYFRSPLKRAARPDPNSDIKVPPYLPNTDPEATVLGAEQWAWLAEQLKKPAELRLLCTGIQVVADDHPFEKWANFPLERAKLLKTIRDSGAAGVVVLSGDRHLAELSVDTTSVGYPLYDVTSSGINQGSKGWRPPEKNSRRVAAMPFGDNWGFISIDWSDDPRVSLSVRDEDGEVVFQHKVRLSLLKPGSTAVVSAQPKEPAPAEKLPDGVLTPEAARAKVDEAVTVQFAVAGGRAISPKLVLLNSEKDFRSEKNLTVAVKAAAMTGPFEKATYDTFKGKTIRAKGTVKKFKDQVQIEIEDAANLEIVEK